MPARADVSEADIYHAIREDIDKIAQTAVSVFEQTPPELIGDIYEHGIVLTGGGAMIKGLDKYLSDATGVKCYVASDPLGCVARGTYLAFKLKDSLRNGFERIAVFKR